MAMFLSVMALGLTAGDAEAKRLGGGKTFGMQRQAVQPAPTRPTQQAAPASTGSTVTAAAPKRSWMGPIAGLAAGLGLAALFSHLGLGAEMANIVMIGLLLMAALFVFRMLFRRKGCAGAVAGYAVRRGRECAEFDSPIGDGNAVWCLVFSSGSCGGIGDSCRF